MKRTGPGKHIAVLAAAFAALFFLFSIFGEIPVLMYHFVDSPEAAKDNSLIISTETFQKQLRWLKAWGFRVYTLDELYAMKAAREQLHPKGVVITFDDGNQDFYHRVLPVLEKENVPAANFLISGHLKNREQGSMSAEEVRLAAYSPWVTFGAHTVSHPELENLPPARLESEIIGSKRELERILGKPVHYFAYPSGVYDAAAFQVVERAGFRLAFTTSWKHLITRKETLLALTRVKITERDSNPAIFWLKVSGVYSWLNQWKHILFFARHAH